jgi:Uma2 family endonuclease
MASSGNAHKRTGIPVLGGDVVYDHNVEMVFPSELAMSSLLANPIIRDAVVPLTVDQYRRMGEAGVIDQRTELIRGVILRKMNKSPLHTLTVKKLVNTLRPLVPSGFELRKEEPLTLAHSEPEPDIAMVDENSYDPGQCHPATAEWVGEVALSSEAIDREKASIYAEAGIPEYWLVLPEKKILERFTNPSGEAYLCHESLRFDTTIETVRLKLAIDLRILS